MKYDIFTGAEIAEGEQPIHITKMCLNCKYVMDSDDCYRCCNDAVMEKGKEKILSSLPEGFEVETLVLKPMNLKNPTKKCGNYDFNLDAVISVIEKEIK